MTLDLDHEASLDPARSGAKAAWLARARQSGLPVLPGLVVEASASRAHMDRGAGALAVRGSGGARLAIMEEPLAGADKLVETAASLGERLVARSSTALEASGEWSGAFSSYVDIAPTELPKAVVGCWASAFSVSTLERQAAAAIEPGSFPMAVLVQPALDPAAGGTAHIEEDGTITVIGVKGAPAPLLQGWVTGHRGGSEEDGTWTGLELVDLLGVPVLDEIAAQLRHANTYLGATRCEWAWQDRVWLLQLGVDRRTEVGVTNIPEMEDPATIPIARVAAMAPGRLGEEMVLPWALSGVGGETEIAAHGRAWRGVAPQFRDSDPASSDTVPLPEATAMELRDRLVAEVWGLPADDAMAAAEECIRALLGHDPSWALDRIRKLNEPDPTAAALLLAHVGASTRPNHAARVGVGRWEPFVASVIFAFGTRHQGTPASPGIGAGVVAGIGRPVDTDDFRPRDVVTASEPVPDLAPLLWDASGLVTRSGSPAAHLFESARALGIPAVCGVELPAGPHIAAVDGHNGVVATLPLYGDRHE